MILRLSMILAVGGLLGASEVRPYISVNGSQKVTVWQGSPVIVEARILGGEEAPAATQWRVRVFDAARNALSFSFRLSGDGGEQRRRLEWTLDGAETRDLAPGPYEFDIATDAYSPGTSNRVRVVLTPRPEQPSTSELAKDLQWQVYHDVRNGMVTTALNRVESWLEANPDDVRALALRADLLDKAGRTIDALIAYAKAIEAEETMRRTQHSREPAEALYIRRDALLRRLLQQ